MEQREEHGVEEDHQLVVAVLAQFHLDGDEGGVRVGGSAARDSRHVAGVGLIAVAVEEVDLHLADEPVQYGHDVAAAVRVSGSPACAVLGDSPLVRRINIRISGVPLVSICVAQTDGAVGDAVAIRHHAAVGICLEPFAVVLLRFIRRSIRTFGRRRCDRRAIVPAAGVAVVTIGKAREELSAADDGTEVDPVEEAEHLNDRLEDPTGETTCLDLKAQISNDEIVVGEVRHG